MGRILAGVALVVGAVLAAQEPPASKQEPIDLEAIARQLEREIEKGELPPVLDKIPAERLQSLVRLGDLLTREDVDELVRWQTGSEAARMAAAVRVLRIDDARSRPAVSLYREFLACSVLCGMGEWSGDFADMFGLAPVPEWRRSAIASAGSRMLGLGARLLREHPDDPLVGRVLLRCSHRLRDLPGIHREARRRLGTNATAADLLSCANLALHSEDLLAAEEMLAAARAAAPPVQLAERQEFAVNMVRLPRDLAEAKQHAEMAKQPGLEGRIARLRLLQITNSDAAFAECRQMIEDGVAHALPSSVLAGWNAWQGRIDEAKGQIDRAMSLPGKDAYTVAALFFVRFSLIAREKVRSGDEPDAKEDVEALLRTADEILLPLESEEARFFRWVRKEWDFASEGMMQAVARSLPAALALQRSLPESRLAYLIVLGAAALTDDDAAALDAIRAPIPTALSGLHDLASLRASLFVTRHLRMDRSAPEADLDAVLGDLERAQQDPRDASWLRGVLQWSRAIRDGGTSEDLLAARSLFVKARRGLRVAGWWRSACALEIADEAVDASGDFAFLLDRVALRDGGEQGLGATLLTFLAKGKDAPPWVADHVRRAIAADSPAGDPATLHAATAEGLYARGDIAGARDSARRALEAMEQRDPRTVPYDRGVACANELRWGLVFRGARLEFTAILRNDLWILPKLPDRAWLQKVASAK